VALGTLPVIIKSMPDDTRSDSLRSLPADEDLIAAYRAGDKNALEILFTRYLRFIKAYLFRISWIQDEGFIEDVRQIVLMTAFNGIIKGIFTDTRPASFRKWLYTICRVVCLKQNEKQARLPQNISQLYPETPTAIPDDLSLKVSEQGVDYEQLHLKQEEALAQLSPSEQKLMQLISVGKKYKEILKEPEFATYSLDYLMRKVYLIRKKMKKEGE